MFIEYYRKKSTGDECENITFERVKDEDIKIKGYSIEEVITILNGLEIERKLDIKMTMDNLSVLVNKIQEDFQSTINKVMENTCKLGE